MRKTIRTLSLMMVALFALSILPGGKGLSSANAYDDPCPEKAKMKFTWGGLYTDLVWVPYVADTGYPYSPTNPAAGFGVELRDYDNGTDARQNWMPTFYPFTFSIPVPPYSYTTGVPYLCTPSYFSRREFNTKTVTYVDQVPNYYPMVNDGTVTHSGVAHAIPKPDDYVNYVWHLTTETASVTPGTLSTDYLTYTVPILGHGAPNEEITFVSSRGGPSQTSIADNGHTFRIAQPVQPGTYTATLRYKFDNYGSGWWDWEETVPYNQYANGTYRAPSWSEWFFTLTVIVGE